MPTTKKSHVIGVKVANLSDKEYVKVINFTSGGSITGQVSSGECLLNPADSDLTWNEGDTIVVESNGRRLESASTTISKGGAKVTLTLTANDDSPQINL